MLGPVKIKIEGSRSQPRQLRVLAQDSEYVVGACHGRTVIAAADTRWCTVSATVAFLTLVVCYPRMGLASPTEHRPRTDRLTSASCHAGPDEDGGRVHGPPPSGDHSGQDVKTEASTAR